MVCTEACPQENNVNKKIFLTGASTGIGRQLCYEFAAAGHDLAISARRMDKLIEIKQELEQRYDLLNEPDYTFGPAHYYQIAGSKTRVGFISPHSHNFCSRCNRVRLTPEGRLLLCLGQEHSVDIRQIIRSHPGDIHILKKAIVESMAIKPLGHEFDLTSRPVILRHMNVTGG